MFFISLKPGEQILIGKDIIVQVLKIRGNQVGIGVEAPPQVSIYRAEVRGRDGQRPGGGTARRTRPHAGNGEADAVEAPVAGALLAATVRCLAIQTHRVVCTVADGRAASCAPRIRALLQHVVQLRCGLRERGSGNVLLRWLESVQQQLEDLQHMAKDEGTKEFTRDTNRRDHPDDQPRPGSVHPVIDMGFQLRMARRRAVGRPAEQAGDGFAMVAHRLKLARALCERGSRGRRE
jgi:carbon storage regulator